MQLVKMTVSLGAFLSKVGARGMWVWLGRPRRETWPVQEEFLGWMREVGPDLCVTAAYGNILPQAFLDIPACGTLNIHPSLLPKYRGAAPVQRALQACPPPLPATAN